MRIKGPEYQSVYKCFPEKYIDIISGYIERINNLFHRYEVVIFMARKAYCFYLALKHNGLIIDSPSCVVLSSRSLSYNIQDMLKNKRIALVDDIVVKGKTLEETFNRLIVMQLDKLVDVYIAACCDNTVEEYANNAYNGLKGPYVHLDESSILELTKCITTYISLSTVSYNMDSPRYSTRLENPDVVNWIIRDNGCINISVPLQRQNSILNYVIHFMPDMISELLNSAQIASDISKKILLKFRLLYNTGTRDLTVLPFVLFPALDTKSIKTLYSRIIPNNMDNLVYCSYNEKITLRNMLSLIEYQLGRLLVDKVLIARYDIGLELDSSCEIALFGTPLSRVVHEDLIPSNCWELYQKSPSIDGFELTELIGNTYGFLLNGVSEEFCNHLGQVKKGRHFSLEEYKNTINPDGTINPFTISTIIDMFIDKGIVIPELLFNSRNQLVKTYRTGEMMMLTHSELLVLASFISAYCNNVKRTLNRTELEKLCVILYRYCHHQQIFQRSTISDPNEIPEDYYGICYTQFGPRISSSSCYYEIKNEESCITKHMLNNGYICMDPKGKYYSADSINLPDCYERYNIDIQFLAMTSAQLTQRLGIPSASIGNSVKNMVTSANDLLTLVAIGNREKDQVLSLVAEIRLFANLSKTFTASTFVTYMGNVMDAIWSGVWKYECYQKINIDTDYVRPILADQPASYIGFRAALSTKVDNNPEISKFMTLCGNFLVRCAQFYEAAKIATKKTGRKIPTRLEALDLSELKSENLPSFNPNDLPSQFITLRNEALALVDICNLYLDESALSYQPIKSVYVVHSVGSMPETILHDVHKIDFQWDLFDNTHIAVLWMKDETQSHQDHLEYILKRCAGTSVQIFNCYLSSWIESIYCCPQTNIARGSFFNRLIKSVLEREKQYTGKNSELLFCKKHSDSNDVLAGISWLVYFESYPINNDYVVDRYAINYTNKEEATMTVNITQNGGIMNPVVNPSEKVVINQPGIYSPVVFNESVMNELEAIKHHLETGNVSPQEKSEISGAIKEFEAAPAEKKQSVFPKLLKTIAKLGGDVLTRLSATIIHEYLKQSGLLG